MSRAKSRLTLRWTFETYLLVPESRMDTYVLVPDHQVLVGRVSVLGEYVKPSYSRVTFLDNPTPQGASWTPVRPRSLVSPEVPCTARLPDWRGDGWREVGTWV